MRMYFFIYVLCLLNVCSWTFTLTPFINNYNPKQLSQSTNLKLASIDDESAEDRAYRMNIVRQLQKSFYQNEDVILPPEKGSRIMKDLPLWRVQWTELPGFQNVLNVHVAHYTNMFQKILFSDTHPKYFGHIYLPGGSENLDNSNYKLEEGTKSTLIGVLMHVSDYKQLDDGRLVMIVQAVERFRIVETQRHHSPYAIATVEILPDEEFIESFDVNDGQDPHALAVESAFQLHPYEIRPVTLNDCAVNGETEIISVSPLSNFNAEYKISENFMQGNVDMHDRVFEVERKVWIKLDEMINLLQLLMDPKKENDLPIPTQILNLLPTKPYQPWPNNFKLEQFAKKLQDQNILVGTHTKSPFVRVDDALENYSPYRRAQRLSFVIPFLIDTVIALRNEHGNTRQLLLEIESTEERLDVILEKLGAICNFISELLESR